MAATGKKRTSEGIEVRHGRSCPARHGGRCRCVPPGSEEKAAGLLDAYLESADSLRLARGSRINLWGGGDG